MLTEMFIRQRLLAAFTLRTSSAQLRLLLLTATQIMASALRLVTQVRTCCFIKLSPSSRYFVLQTAKTRPTSLYMVNFSKQNILTRPPPPPQIPSPYFNSVPHTFLPRLHCNNRDYPDRMTPSRVSRPCSCAPKSVALRSRPQPDSNDGKTRRYFKTHATS